MVFPLLKVDNVSKSFGSKTVLNSISFEVLSGETVAIIGKNGSGKSTLINIVSDILKADSGKILVNGFPHYSKKAKLQRGVILQDYRPEKNFTGLEVLMAHCMFYDVDKKYALNKSLELLEFMALTEYADKEVQTYSTGMKKRLQMAKALLHSPKLLLLDEPTAEMDSGIKKEIWKYLNKLKSSFGIGIMISTHDGVESKKFGDKILDLESGQIKKLTSGIDE